MGDITGAVLGFNRYLRNDLVTVLLRALSNALIFCVLVRLPEIA